MTNTEPIKLNNRGKIGTFTLSVISIFTIGYFTWWLNLNHAGHPVLYALLFVGEVFHVWQALGYIFTVWSQKEVVSPKITKYYPVDIFITVCGEPAEIVEKTIQGALSIDYPNFKVYILNDGKGAGKHNWREIDELALRYGVIPITRERNGGFKAGNLNNALRQTKGEFFAVFDADQIPEKNFLTKTIGFFKDPLMALVQTPQYYANKDENSLTKAAWEQQELFFGPICVGKNRYNATLWCGTNAVVRKNAIYSIGGVPEHNIAEDFLASLFLHEKGWKSIYVPEILAKGLAPHNLSDYVNQQFRWARGSLEVIFKYNPLFRKGLSWAQKIQYLYSSGYYLNGLIVIIDAVIPLAALTFNVLPVNASTSDFMIYFFPFIFSTIYLLMMSTRNQITFNAIQLSMSSFFVFFIATLSTAFGIKAAFKVTNKSKETGNFLNLVIPHALYTIAAIISIVVAVIRDGIVPSVVTNAAWAVFNITFFSAFFKVAYPWDELWSRVTSLFHSEKEDVVSPSTKLAYTFVEAARDPEFDFEE